MGVSTRPHGASVPQRAAVEASGSVRLGRLIVGHVDADGVFWRRVEGRHVLRQPPAIALHVVLLDALGRAGVEAVAFQLDGGELLTGPLSLYHERGIPIDRGFGAQLAVVLADFLRVDVQEAAPEAVGAFLDSLT